MMLVLICDDHPIVASAIGMTVENAFDAEVCIAHSCADALDQARALGAVDLILLDLHIPGEDPRANLDVTPSFPPLGLESGGCFAHQRG